jgi:hypothetical protein
MEDFIVLQDGECSKAISQFLTESGAIITPETSLELEKQVLNNLSAKIQIKQLTRPEFSMAIMEIVMPLCPNTATKTAMVMKSTRGVISSVLNALNDLVVAAQGGVPHERLRIKAENFNNFLKKSKNILAKNANEIKKYQSEISVLKSKASSLLDTLESDEIISTGQYAEKYSSLSELVSRRGESVGEGVSKTKKREINSAYDNERTTRQLIALELYYTKSEIAAIKGAIYGIIKIKTIFDRIPMIAIEQGEHDPGMFSPSMIGMYIRDKIPTISEAISARPQEVSSMMKIFGDIYDYKSALKSDDTPVNKLMDLMPAGDYITKNYIKLMSLEEIVQNSGQKTIQKASPGIGLNKSSISYSDFIKSLPGIDLSKYIDEDTKEKIETIFDDINNSEMTWRKGMSVYLFSDPPTPDTVKILEGEEIDGSNWRQTTIGGGAVDVSKTEESLSPLEIKKLENEKSSISKQRSDAKKALKNAVKPETIKKLEQKIVALESKGQEIESILKQLGQTELKGQYNVRGATPLRRLFEANRTDAHWINLLNAIRPAYINRETIEQDMQTLDKYKEATDAVGSKVKDKKDRDKIKRHDDKIRVSLDKALGTPGVKSLNSKDMVMTAIENDATPSWILMRAVEYPYDKQTSDLAEFNLEDRGWSIRTDEAGEDIEDNFGDKVWQHNPKTSSKKTTKGPVEKTKKPVEKTKKPVEKTKKPVEKTKKSSVLSIRDKTAQDMSRNLDQQVEAAKAAKDAADKQQKLLEQEKQMKQNDVNSPSAAIAPANTPAAMGVNPATGVKTFSAKDRLSKRG